MNLCISSSFASPNVHLQNPERATQIGSSQLGIRCAVKMNSSEESIVGGEESGINSQSISRFHPKSISAVAHEAYQ